MRFFFPLLPLSLLETQLVGTSYRRVPNYRATHLLVVRGEALEIVRVRLISEDGIVKGAAPLTSPVADTNNLIDEVENVSYGTSSSAP